MRVFWRDLVPLMGLLSAVVSADDELPRAPSSVIRKAGPTFWPRPGQSSKAGPAVRLPRKESSALSRSGPRTRPPDIWSARATAATSGSAGTASWAISSTTSNGDSRRSRARRVTTPASMPVIRRCPGSTTRLRLATAPAVTCSAQPSPRGGQAIQPLQAAGCLARQARGRVEYL